MRTHLPVPFSASPTSLSLLAGAFLAGSPGWAACPEPLSPDGLDQRLEAAERDLGDLDSDAFLADTADLDKQVACLDAPVDAKLAARIHRAFALRSYLGREESQARVTLVSSKAVDPNYVFPFWLLPERHELRDIYAEVPDDRPMLPVLPAKRGELRFDGVPVDDRPQLHPAVVQVLDNEGKVLRSEWVRATDVLPEYDEARPVLPRLAGSARTVRTTLLVTAASTAVLAGASYGVAGIANGRFNNTTSRDTVLSSQRLANTMVTTSAISGGVAVVSFGSAFFVGRF